MYTNLAILGLLLSGSRLVEASPGCPAIGGTVTASQGGPTVTANAGTSAVAQSSGTIQVNSCGQGYLEPDGYGILNGGTIGAAGSPSTLSGAGASFATISPITSVTGTVTTAYNAYIYGASGASLTITTMSSVVATASPRATLMVNSASDGILYGLGGQVTVSSASDGISIFNYGTGHASMNVVTAYPRSAYFEVNGQGANGELTCTGCYPQALAGATMTWYGEYGRGYVINTATMILARAPTSITLTAWNTAVVTVTDGTGNLVTASSLAEAFITGANTAYVVSNGIGVAGLGANMQVATLGTATIASGATATVSSGGVATISSGALAQFRAGGRGTLLLSATVTADPQAALVVTSAATTLTSLGVVGTSTIYAARSVQSGGGGAGRRAIATFPRATGRCGKNHAMCPGVGCVNIAADITSGSIIEIMANPDCGGCALLGEGVDCTEQTDGMVACKSGKCVFG